MNPFLQKRYGLLPIEIDEAVHYIMGDGSLAPKVIMPLGHGWANFLPVDDLQAKNGVETMNCTSYGTLHALATLGKKNFGPQFQTSLSERYTGIMSGTGPNGNDPHTVIETIRTLSGVIPEVFMPFDQSIKTFADYYQPALMPYNWFAVGRHWLKKYKVSHQWLWNGDLSVVQKQQLMKTALQYSPLGASVFAWSYPSNGLYIGNPMIHNHWITVYDYVEGQEWLIFDSYDQTHKKLAWDFDFGMAKGYGLDFNLGGAVLGEQIEPAYLPYFTYRVGAYFGEIFK